MAKKPVKVTATVAAPATGINIGLLTALVAATAAGSFMYISPADGNPMVGYNPPLIEVDTNNLDKDNNAAARALQPAANDFLAANASGNSAPAVAASNGAGSATESKPMFAIIQNAILPAAKPRGGFGSGAPTIYPFADLEVGGSFFVANTDVSKGDAVKTLGSTVSSANARYAEETGEMKKGKRAKKDENGEVVLDAEGKRVMETVDVPVLKYNRRFRIAGVEAGKAYGEWTAPADGALISRVS